ncbi:MAG: alkaline shock response membrane anchor protein AmaP [Firmicutes bacterium]|nr:alkaline shock response membrane anchor protein AmaP [Bacillota bacterium]
MRTSYRLVLIIGSLVMLVLAMFFLGLLMGRDPAGLTEVITGGEEMNIYKLIGFAIFFLLFLILFMTGLSGEKSPRIIIHETEMGQVRIAVTAVESLALRAIDKIRGVKEATVAVEAENEGLRFEVEIVSNPDPERNLPQLTSEIRSKLADYIHETVGIPVIDSTVTVTKVTTESRARVE